MPGGKVINIPQECIFYSQALKTFISSLNYVALDRLGCRPWFAISLYNIWLFSFEISNVGAETDILLFPMTMKWIKKLSAIAFKPYSAGIDFSRQNLTSVDGL